MPSQGDWKFSLCQGGAANPNAGTEIVSGFEGVMLDKQLTFRLNRPSFVQWKVPSNHELVNTVWSDGYPYVSVGDRTLKGWRYESGSWEIRFSGILWTLQDQGDQDANPYTTLTAFDPLQFLTRRLIRRNDGNLRKRTRLANNAAAAIKRHIDKTITYAGPCYINTSDGYFEPGLTYLVFVYHQEYIARAFYDVTGTGEVDIDFQAVDRTNGELVVANALGRKGADKTGIVHLDYDTGNYGAFSWERNMSMDTAANYLLNMSGDKKKFSEVSDAPSQSRFGVLENSTQYTDIVHQTYLSSLTAGELSERKQPREIVMVTPTPGAGAAFDPITDYYLGDTIKLNSTSKVRQGISGVVRVYSMKFDIDNDGPARVTELGVSPNNDE